jgi:hypothetical protein
MVAGATHSNREALGKIDMGGPLMRKLHARLSCDFNLLILIIIKTVTQLLNCSVHGVSALNLNVCVQQN